MLLRGGAEKRIDLESQTEVRCREWRVSKIRVLRPRGKFRARLLDKGAHVGLGCVLAIARGAHELVVGAGQGGRGEKGAGGGSGL